jgi:ligand-binding sensor domain-containing protein
MMIPLFCLSASGEQTFWEQYRSFGGLTVNGDINTIISDARYVYAFSSSSGIRYDKLWNKWEYTFPRQLPAQNFKFTAIDPYFDDLYFIFSDRLVLYRIASDIQYPPIYLSGIIEQVAFSAEGIWVQTTKGYYLCNRWTGKSNKMDVAPSNITWYGKINRESLRNDQHLFFLADPLWDKWAGLHYLTAYAAEFAGRYVWAAYSGMGLWRYDNITGERTQITKGLLSSSNVNGLYAFENTVGITGDGGVTLVNTERDQWQQLDRMFNLDLKNYHPSCLVYDTKTLYIGTNRGVVVLKRGDDFASVISSYDKLPDDEIISLSLVSDTLWIGTKNGLAFYQINTKGSVENCKGADGNIILDIAADHRYLYLATNQGALMLDRADSLRILRYDSKAPPEIFGEILGVALDGDDIWWLTGDLLFRYDKIKMLWERYSWTDKYNAGRGVVFAVDKSNLWIGTNNGLVRYKKSEKIWTVYRGKDGLLDDAITQVLSYNGILWVGGEHGLSVFLWQKGDLKK